MAGRPPSYALLSRFKNPEQSADEDAEKNEEDSEGEGGDPRCRLGEPRVRASLGLLPWLSFSLALHPPSSCLSPFSPGSSDEDEDEDGVSAAAFLKKKSEAPSGESRKFLKKMEVRGGPGKGLSCLPGTILGSLGRRRGSRNPRRGWVQCRWSENRLPPG